MPGRTPPPDGRWDYGPWVFGFIPNSLNVPPFVPLPGEAADLTNPSLYHTTTTPEAFMDTPLVNGTAYPYQVVEQRRYRFRILSVGNDRTLNLQLYYAANGGPGPGGHGATATATVQGGAVTKIKITHGGSGYKSPPGVFITGGGGYGATASVKVSRGAVIGITLTNPGTGYTSAPTVTIGSANEVKMITAPATTGIPSGLIPDPATVGPQFIQIGNEGGLLPAPVVLNDPSTGPIYTDYQMDRRQITFGNVLHKNLMMGPAERADVIVDFSKCPVGSTLILYNDGPAPIPGIDTRYDYMTAGFDYTSTAGNPFGASGGAAQTQVGLGPNTRTIMQFRVVAKKGPADPYNFTTNLAALQNPATGLPNAFSQSQPAPIVPPNDPNFYGSLFNASSTGFVDEEKDINEQFDVFGRMNATISAFNINPGAIVHGVQILGTVGAYVEPPTEVLTDNTVQVWKFVHNGVDTHSIHFHLFNVQVINRQDQIGGVTSGPDPNEMGWKETVRMNPLEITWVAIKPKLPTVPFAVVDSVRPLNPAMSWGAAGQGPAVSGFVGGFSDSTFVNQTYNFGHEYVFHCHILGHEENDMMRPMKITP
jgi:FtsP/CotA-like multicopper oxidase with cupredoxin domain